VAGVQQLLLGVLGVAGFTPGRQFRLVPALAGRLRTELALTSLAANPRVRRVDLDVGGTGALGTSVPLIGADERHANSNDGEGVVVAVLDTGLDTDHPDLVSDVLQQACFGDFNGAIDGVGFCPNGSDRQTGTGAAEDNAGHGTHVSGIITSDGTVSDNGVAPGAGIVGIKVLDNCSFAGCFYFFSEIVAALDYIIANNATLGIEVINMSLGTGALFAGDCDNSTAFNMAGAAAINTLRSMGVLAVASAGNNGSGTSMTSPACLANVIAVAASDNADNATGFTNSNASTDVFAPGEGILSSALGGGTASASGTSMASPHVVGCAALLIESAEATAPDALESRLETSPVQVTDPKNGLSFPRLDCSPTANNPPAISAGGPYSGSEGTAIALSGATASDPDGDPLTLTWSVNSTLCSFSNPAVLRPTLTCADNGTFTATLTAQDGAATTSVSASVVVANRNPVISAFNVTPDTIFVGESVTAAGSFSDVPADVLNATLAWGDGSSAPVTSPFSLDHTYNQSGQYGVALGVSDDDGGASSANRGVTVLSPTAAIVSMITRLQVLNLTSYLLQLLGVQTNILLGQTNQAIGKLTSFANRVPDAELKADALALANALRLGLK
jgi:subtilisin family serine protease